MAGKNPNLREDLIIAGINEINKHGVSEFSVRRVADACHVSCAAPYRHFESKKAFIAAIIDYVNDRWAERQEEILSHCGSSLREQIIEISVNYVRFLMEKPIYRSILMLKDNEFDNLYHKKRTQFGSLTQSLEAELQASSGLPDDVWKRKLMVCRSLIFGMVFLMDAGEYEYNDTAIENLRFTLNREFEVL
ncbi:MAG: TetR/AcrR family transcriptional regulator [Oscillospiraceae bacterium]|nr:TetR/AcrR family transcriptional regulator [Oscillospiraceae bacterium]